MEDIEAIVAKLEKVTARSKPISTERCGRHATPGGLPTITSENQSEHLISTYSAGHTTFTAIPEPSAMLLVFAGAAVAAGRRLGR